MTGHHARLPVLFRPCLSRVANPGRPVKVTFNRYLSQYRRSRRFFV